MAMRQGKCISCGQGLIGKGSTLFTCPGCDEVVGRCGSCREQSVAWASTCAATGP